MASLKIFAADIEHLTDARYFAAFDVYFLSFDIVDDMSIQKAIAMAEWIEGPQIVVHSELLEKMKSINPEAVLFDKNFTNFKVDSNPYTIFYILKIYQPSDIIFPKDLPDFDYLVLDLRALGKLNIDQMIPTLVQVCKNYQVFVDVDLPLEEFIKLLHEISPEGVFIRGGQEEKPGFKSYDELDEWFEGIQIFRENIVE